MSEWQPIETAPRDGTEIILTDEAFVHVGRYDPVADSDYPWRFLDRTSLAAEENGLNGWKETGPTYWTPIPKFRRPA